MLQRNVSTDFLKFETSRRAAVAQKGARCLVIKLIFFVTDTPVKPDWFSLANIFSLVWCLLDKQGVNP